MSKEEHDMYSESRGYGKRVRNDYMNGKFITALEYYNFLNKNPIKEIKIKKRSCVRFNSLLRRMERRGKPRKYFTIKYVEHNNNYREYEWEKYRQHKYFNTKPLSYETIFPFDFSMRSSDEFILKCENEQLQPIEERELRYKKDEKTISDDEWKRKHQLRRCPMNQPIFNSMECTAENSSDDEVVLEEINGITGIVKENNEYPFVSTENDMLSNEKGHENVELTTGGVLSNQQGMEEEYEKTEEIDPMEKNRIKTINDNDFDDICKDIRGLTTTLSFDYDKETYLYINVHKRCLERNSISAVTFFVLRFIKYVNIECDLFATIIEAYGMTHDDHLKGLIQRLELEDYNECSIQTMVINKVITEKEALCDQKLKCRNIECEHCSVNTLICQDIIKGYYDCCYIYCTNVFQGVVFSNRVKMIVVDEKYNGPKELLSIVHKRYNKGKVNEYYTYYATSELINKKLNKE